MTAASYATRCLSRALRSTLQIDSEVRAHILPHTTHLWFLGSGRIKLYTILCAELSLFLPLIFAITLRDRVAFLGHTGLFSTLATSAGEHRIAVYVSNPEPRYFTTVFLDVGFSEDKRFAVLLAPLSPDLAVHRYLSSRDLMTYLPLPPSTRLLGLSKDI